MILYIILYVNKHTVQYTRADNCLSTTAKSYSTILEWGSSLV